MTSLPPPTPSPKHPPSTRGEVCRLGLEDRATCLWLDRLVLGGLWSAEQWEQELKDPQRLVLGWREGEWLAGVACGWVVVDELHITAVAVHPDHRRQGIARGLLEALQRLAREAGAERATLEVSSANGAARALYARLGFQEVAIRRHYYRNGDDALIQWKTFASHKA
ncbi:MAG: ribosomal protein S18-alanine N-acetyltransferase [Cyanobacteriota bacterium]|nr:ribosomal protein S18-alanine N-acetyltransferase [Cyanobacteriota bacterium]